MLKRTLNILKVRKKAKARNRNNKVPRLIKDTIWKCDDKNIKKHHVQEFSSFPAGDHKVARNRRDSMTDGTNRPLISMWIKSNRCLVCMKEPKLIDVSSLSTYKSTYEKEEKTKIRTRQNIQLNTWVTELQQLNTGWLTTDRTSVLPYPLIYR